ncbi:glucokinase [Massilia forsythiae]|uniref:Glucokinase n=1 Tax=Massilia forsythiae TaxID=2728020 RepID=A0A7Z2VZQ2_9BURK|nr:glucokinase [Massilia forsythiae]QJE02179.1 glucokinase [Massilia forsythiae]
MNAPAGPGRRAAAGADADAGAGLRLLADIGGTNARFALQDATAHARDGGAGLAAAAGFVDIGVLACSEHATIGAALDAYLTRAAARGLAVDGIRHAALAIANPVEGDAVCMTNHHWRFSIAALRAERGLDTLLVLNDFQALAMALPHLRAGQRETVGASTGTSTGAGPGSASPVAAPGRPIGLVGPGTGLGVSAVVPCGGRWIALAGEGGHASFAAATRAEARILDALQERFGHVSAERLLSGTGLELIHAVTAARHLPAPEITRRALADDDAACRATVATFCAVLGSVAGNVALTLGATGGMYIGGGIVPRLGRLFHDSAFRARFEDKGRLQPYLARIPTWLVTEPYPALHGAAALLAESIAEDSAERSHERGAGARRPAPARH